MNLMLLLIVFFSCLILSSDLSFFLSFFLFLEQGGELFFWKFLGMILGLGVSATAMATAIGNDSMGRFPYTVIARVSVSIAGGSFFKVQLTHCLIFIYLSSIIVGYVYGGVSGWGYCRCGLGWIGTTGGSVSLSIWGDRCFWS